jgi:hypothetical protein
MALIFFFIASPFPAVDPMDGTMTGKTFKFNGFENVLSFANITSFSLKMQVFFQSIDFFLANM